MVLWGSHPITHPGWLTIQLTHITPWLRAREIHKRQSVSVAMRVQARAANYLTLSGLAVIKNKKKGLNCTDYRVMICIRDLDKANATTIAAIVIMIPKGTSGMMNPGLVGGTFMSSPNA